jgi:PTH1 family peptidyl-tRNA hydrolase
MQYVVVGLGNPGDEYEKTRHNVGRMVVEAIALELGAADWRDDKKLRAKVCQAVIGKKDNVTLVLPDNYMNRSGGSVAPLAKTTKAIERLVVVHDDIDLPFGTIRIVQNRGAGGHNGVLSIERALKSKAFIRVRVGVIPTTPSGKLRKPASNKIVDDFLLQSFTSKEKQVLGDMVVQARDATAAVVTEGREAAQRTYNS